MSAAKKNEPATKADIGQLGKKIDGVRTELKGDFNRMALRIAGNESRMDRMESNIMTELRGFRSELLTAFEDSVIKGRRFEDKALTHGHQLQEHEMKLRRHEKRLNALESPGADAP
ncbi:MAG: hypothetical protein ABIJ96_07055 [Elusimicrobiota bacterium]